MTTINIILIFNENLKKLILKKIHIKNRGEKFNLKQSHDVEIVLIKLNFMKSFKNKKFKKKIKNKNKKILKKKAKNVIFVKK